MKRSELIEAVRNDEIAQIARVLCVAAGSVNRAKAVRRVIRAGFVLAQSVDGVPDDGKDFSPYEDQVRLAMLAAAWDAFCAEFSDP